MSSPRKAEFYLILSTLIWGATFVIVKDAMTVVSPFAFVALRFSLAAVICSLIWHDAFRTMNAQALKDGALLGLLLFGGFALQTAGLVTTSATKSGFITGTVVVFVPFVQYLIERRKPTRWQVVGVILVSIGLWTLAAPREGVAIVVGDVLTLASALIWAFYIVFIDVATHRSDVRALTILQISFVALIAIPISVMYDGFYFEFSGQSVFALLYTAILATVITTFLQTRYQKFITPVAAAIIFALEPVFAALFARTVGGEIMDGCSFTGAIIIITGILIAQKNLSGVTVKEVIPPG